MFSLFLDCIFKSIRSVYCLGGSLKLFQLESEMFLGHVLNGCSSAGRTFLGGYENLEEVRSG